MLEHRDIERLQFLAGRSDPFGDFAAVAARNERDEFAREAVSLGSVAPPEFKNVAKPRRRDQTATRALAFDRRIGCDGGAVHEEIEIGGRDAKRVEAAQ